MVGEDVGYRVVCLLLLLWLQDLTFSPLITAWVLRLLRLCLSDLPDLWRPSRIALWVVCNGSGISRVSVDCGGAQCGKRGPRCLRGVNQACGQRGSLGTHRTSPCLLVSGAANCGHQPMRRERRGSASCIGWPVSGGHPGGVSVPLSVAG